MPLALTQPPTRDGKGLDQHMTKQEIATAPVAAAAIFWPKLHEWIAWMASEAQLLLPILGATWLLVQIISKVYSTWWKK